MTAEVISPPVPISQGTYAIFETPKGGLHLVYRVKGAAEDTHLEIPAFVMQMAQRASGQDGMDLSKMLGAVS